ncbi:Smg-4/UPF3 family-domain-containing protein [Hyaloraphidium curvatum]|nr:Smg-4/UPF3 family-domain-containing protein [Hyaloraphidium curvatum]
MEETGGDASAAAPAAAAAPAPRERRRRNRDKEREQPPTKVVVRRLPPALPEDVLRTSLEKWLPATDWWLFVPGKLSKTKAKESQFARAYMHFRSPDAVVEFSRAYDGHAFVDSRGNEYRAVVELAPSQRMPKPKKKRDPKQGSIETDPDYVAFLEAFNNPALPMPSLLGIPQPADAPQPDTGPSVAPLVAYLREKRANAAARRARKEAEMAKVQVLQRGKGGQVKAAPPAAPAEGKKGKGGKAPEAGKGPDGGRQKQAKQGVAPKPTAAEQGGPAGSAPGQVGMAEGTSGGRRRRGGKPAAAPPAVAGDSPAPPSPSAPKPTNNPAPSKGQGPAIVIRKADGSTSSFNVPEQPAKPEQAIDASVRGVLAVDPASLSSGRGGRSGRRSRGRKAAGEGGEGAGAVT